MDLTQKLRKVVRAIVGMPEDPGQPPLIDRLAWYRAEVTACASDGSTCDVQPEDSRISPENGVKVLVGIPGASAVVQPGAVVMLGWERGDPARPRCLPIWEAGATVTKLIINATSISIGADGLAALINGLVLAKGIDPFTGATYGALGNASATVMAKP